MYQLSAKCWSSRDDGSAEAIQEKFHKVYILPMPDNRGYPHALNAGIKKSLEQPIQWILLLNNDVIVDKNCLREFSRFINHEQIYLFSPAIYYYNEPNTIWYMGEKLIEGTLIGYRYYRNKQPAKDLPPLIKTDFLNGCAMLVNRCVFDKIGLFDDNELIYGDDPDFSWRAKQAGFRAATVTTAKIWHKVSRTMNIVKPKTRYLKVRNTIRFYRKYAKGLSYLVMFFFTFVRSALMSLGDIFKKRYELLLATWKGWIDGWFMTPGRKTENI